MPRIQKYFWLIALSVLFLLRFWQLSTIPATLNPDEASVAYNAYLLGETGTDEWGKSWPLVLEAFGDQKVAGYTLLVVPLVKLFGMVDWAVRLPAALASVLVAVVAAWMVYRWQRRWELAALVLVVLGVQPVFIWYGRMAFEAVVALLYILLLLCAALGKWRRQWLQWLGIVLLVVMSCFTYNAPLVLIPFIGSMLPWWHGFKKWKLWLPQATLMAITWLACVLISQNLTAQKSQITIFGDETLTLAYGEYRQQFSGVAQKIVGNKYVFYAGQAGQRFVASLSPAFMIRNEAGHPWHSLPGTGYVTWTVYIFGWLGWMLMMYQVWRSRKELPKVKNQLVWMYLTCIAVIPASITVNAPHATRSLLFFVGWGVSASYAAWLMMEKWRYLRIPIILLLLLPSLVYGYLLFVQYPKSPKLQAPLQPGLAEMLKQRASEQSSDLTAIVDGRGFTYVSVAWYARIPAADFYRTIVKQQPDKINFKYGERVGNYHFIGNLTDPTAARRIIYWDTQQLKWDIKP